MPNMQNEKTPVREQAPDIRNKNFLEVSLGYTSEEALNEAQRCLNCKNAPCMNGCPVNVKIPEFIQLLKENKIEDAYYKIKETSSLPAVCGRVCPQESQCEKNCVRGIKGQAVAIGRLERFVADYFMANCKENEQRTEKNGHKVAVVGSGPSGLSCAGDLARMGYEVTVFEKATEIGGSLRTMVASGRLPECVLNDIIDDIKSKGAKFELGSEVSETVEGFDAVIKGYIPAQFRAS